METHTSTEEAIGLLLLCSCNQLDPCCIQQIALTSFRDGEFGNPIFRAAFLCVLSQWWAQQRLQLAPMQAPAAPYAMQAPAAPYAMQAPAAPYAMQAPAAPYAMQAPAAPCSTNIAPFLFTLVGQGFAKSLVDFFVKTACPSGQSAP